jgi:signal transduction histidine kinase
MYFGGINGFNAFYPENITEKPYDPPLVITDFKIFNQRVPVSDEESSRSPLTKHINETREINLSYKESVISFEFASLNYTNPKKKQYAYMLEGFDTGWNYEGSNRTATYKNLEPGNYVFKVKGLDNAGNWSDRTASVVVAIQPPFWKTVWFRFLSVLLFSGSLYTVYRYRVSSIKKRQRMLEQQVQERTETIRAQNELLREQGEELESQRAALEVQNRKIAEKNSLLENHQQQLEQLVEQRTLELVKMNQELADKNARFEQYGFVTSHNFRGPVATLLGLTSIFNSAAPGDPVNRYVIDKIRETTARVDEMIQDLSKLLHTENNLESLFQPVALAGVLDNVQVLLAQEITGSGTRIRADFSELPVLPAVPAYINSIFYNLITNAIKFRKPDTVPQLSIRSFPDEDRSVIEFRDNGTGIDLSLHGDNLFQPFRRFTTQVAGKGLGLYLVKTQLKAMNGDIEVSSTPGEGTSFRLIFSPAGSLTPVSMIEPAQTTSRPEMRD